MSQRSDQFEPGPFAPLFELLREWERPGLAERFEAGVRSAEVRIGIGAVLARAEGFVDTPAAQRKLDAALRAFEEVEWDG